MTALEKFNRENHRYIYSVEKANNHYYTYVIHGCIGRRYFLYYSLREAIRKYNMEAKTTYKAI